MPAEYFVDFLIGRIALMIEKVLNMFIGVLESVIDLIIDAMNRVISALIYVIRFILTVFSKLLTIIGLLIQLLFYLLPFGEVIYVGWRLRILWLTVVGTVFVVMFTVAFVRALIGGGSPATPQYTKAIFAIFIVLNVALGAISGFLYFDLKLPMRL
jgi:hypothetical protein